MDAKLRGEGAKLQGEGAKLRGEGAKLRGEGAKLRGDRTAKLPRDAAKHLSYMYQMRKIDQNMLRNFYEMSI